MAIVSLIILAAIIGFVVYQKKKQKQLADEAQTSARKKKPNPWKAVSIQVGESHCHAVNEYLGTRYLASEAPELPVPGCGKSHCHCRYKFHEDRRSGHDRRFTTEATQRNFAQNFPNRNRGRRKSDYE